MTIQELFEKKPYQRSVQGMGEGLVLFEISVQNRRIGQNYHIFFGDGRKPPLDIAINPDSGAIEYISCFAQDEVIVEELVRNCINFTNLSIAITDTVLSEKNVNIVFNKSFKILKRCNDIFILREDLLQESLQAYVIGDSNYILFSEGEVFSGLILTNVLEEEWKEIIDSKCI